MKKLRLLGLLVTAFLPVGRGLVYRIVFRAVVGKRVRFGFGAVLIFDRLVVGDDCRIGSLCIVRAHHIELGSRTRIGIFTRINLHTIAMGPSVTIGPQVSILADYDDPRCSFTAGAESWVFEYCYLNPARPIRLGRNVGVGGGSYIFTHGLWLSSLKGYPVSYGEVDIGNDVWLPWGCFIMPGVTIGDGAIVGARSLVTKSIPANALAAGTPAKVLRERVAEPPAHERKLEILDETTREFCTLRSLSHSSRLEGDWVVVAIGGRETLAFASAPKPQALPANVANVLRVVAERYCDAEPAVGPVFSLESFQCSRRDALTPLQAAWLQHLRRIGTRHYPIDETPVE